MSALLHPEPKSIPVLPSASDALAPYDVRAASHSVDFYADDAVFLDNLSETIRRALAAGGVCLVIAAAPHRQGIAQRLRAAGIDLSLAVRNSQYVLLDAEATLAKFMVDGMPDPDRFVATLEPVLAAANANLGPGAAFPVAFGEMVALLWAEGKRDAAVRLEQLWNDLACRHSFHLLCAYPRHAFTPADKDAFFDRICAEHHHIVSSGSSN